MTTSLSLYASNTRRGIQMGFYCVFFKRSCPDPILFMAGAGPVQLQQCSHVMKAVLRARVRMYIF